MAIKNTSVALGDHLTEFVEDCVASGSYGNASDVIRAGLRLLEEHEKKMIVLREAVRQGMESPIIGELDIEEIKRSALIRAGLS